MNTSKNQPRCVLVTGVLSLRSLQRLSFGIIGEEVGSTVTLAQNHPQFFEDQRNFKSGFGRRATTAPILVTIGHGTIQILAGKAHYRSYMCAR